MDMCLLIDIPVSGQPHMDMCSLSDMPNCQNAFFISRPILAEGFDLVTFFVGTKARKLV